MHILSQILCDWYSKHKRDLPWRDTTDAYRIWLSEVILQQTRVAQGTDYFERFIETFPTVQHLALAHEDEVLKLWQGLGYYSRARNLHKTAKIIVQQYEGLFPNSYNRLLALPGVGRYTAAAISSFAFGQATPVLDGNVFRVVSRLFAIDAPIDIQSNLKLFDSVLNDLILETDPSIFNQSIMEFGALHCVPQNPKCDICPLMPHCLAYKFESVANLPIKSKKIVQTQRYFNYIFVVNNDKTYIRQRKNKDIWQNLYEPIMLESDKQITISELEDSVFFTKLFPASTYRLVTLSKRKHLLTHQQIFAQMFVVFTNDTAGIYDDYLEIRISDMGDFAVPRLVDLFLQDAMLYLSNG